MTAMPPLRDILNNTPADAIDVDFNFNTIEAHIANEVINRDGSVAMTGQLTLAGAPVAPAHAVNKAYVDGFIPVGVMEMYAGSVAPGGWAFCDGSSKSTTDPAFVALFAVIGYTYGGAGGNFNLPDLRGRFPVGRNATDASFDVLGEKGGSKDATLPSHSHNVNAHAHYVDHSHNANHAHSASSGTESADHTHSGTTDAQGAHNHDVGGGLLWAQFGAGTLGMDTSGTGHSGAPSNLGALSQQPDHVHNFGTGGRSAAHTHGITVDANNFNTGNMNGRQYTDNAGSTTDAQGAAAGNANLPPYIAINFIIRIG